MPVHSENVHFQLPPESGPSFDLVVSSLGSAAQTFEISLTAIPQPRALNSLLPIHPEFAGRFPQTTLPVRHNHLAPETPHVHEGPVEVPSTRRFYLHVTEKRLEDPQGYAAIEGHLVQEGRAVRVYLDSSQTVQDLAPGLINFIVNVLDAEIIPQSRELLGDLVDIDGDGKLAVLVTPWLGKLRGGQVSIKGCVRSGDFQRRVEVPFGSAADILYLNSELVPGPSLKTVLAHEYTHAVCFSQRFGRDAGVLPVEDDWLNEAIAHVAENLHGSDWSNLEDRINAFRRAPARSPLVVTDYYRAGLWRDAGCRGATYLFLRYCVDQCGPTLLPALIQNPETGCRNLERATGLPFSELFRHWTISLTREAMPLQTAGGQPALSRIEWDHGSGPCVFALRGTATAFIRVKRSAIGPLTLRLCGARDSQLQVTVVSAAASAEESAEPATPARATVALQKSGQ
ncbi:MAG: hypothetical protein JSS02_27270 [Planctomycetes bacterium]|nr:hypothetical protein [Planctomycetota bacterium]